MPARPSLFLAVVLLAAPFRARGQEVAPPAPPEPAAETPRAIADAESAMPDDLRHEPPRSPYRAWSAIALAGGTAFLLGAGITAAVNNRCDDCAGRITPWVLAGAGTAAYAAGAFFWIAQPDDPRRAGLAAGVTLRY